MTNVTAKIISETSAGALICQIYDGEELVWSHHYSQYGMTERVYRDMMSHIRTDAESCAEYADYDGCDLDDDNNVIDYLTYGDTY